MDYANELAILRIGEFVTGIALGILISVSYSFASNWIFIAGAVAIGLVGIVLLIRARSFEKTIKNLAKSTSHL